MAAEPAALLSEEKNEGFDKGPENTTDSPEVKRHARVRIEKREVVGSERRPICFVEFHQRRICDGPVDWKFEAGRVKSPQAEKVQTSHVKDTSVAVRAGKPAGSTAEMRSAGQQVERKSAAEALGNIEAKDLCAERPV